MYQQNMYPNSNFSNNVPVKMHTIKNVSNWVSSVLKHCLQIQTKTQVQSVTFLDHWAFVNSKPVCRHCCSAVNIPEAVRANYIAMYYGEVNGSDNITVSVNYFGQIPVQYFYCPNCGSLQFVIANGMTECQVPVTVYNTFMQQIGMQAVASYPSF